MKSQFPKKFPFVNNVVQISFPDGLVVQTTVRMVSSEPGNKLGLLIGGNSAGQYCRTLRFRDGKWYAHRLNDPSCEQHEVSLEIIRR